MKRIAKLFLAATLAFVCIPAIHAQTLVAIPSGTPVSTPSVTITITAGTANTSAGTVACTASFPCKYTLYRIGGSCPTTITGTSTWTLVTTTAANATSYQDISVAGSTTYSYVAEALAVTGGANSSPSNCVTVTTPASPLVPSPPAITGS